MNEELVEFSPYGWPEPGAMYLQPTQYLDFMDPAVQAFALKAVEGAAATPRAQAVALFMAVRDRIRHNPYSLCMDPRSFSANAVVAAAARAVGIPSALGLADVINHFTSPKVQQAMGKDVFLNHGYTALHGEGRWLKVAPTFNRELCQLMGVPPTSFDGASDALLQVRSAGGQPEPMCYLHDHGVWSDLPFERIRDDFMDYYPASMWDQRTAADVAFAHDNNNSGRKAP